MKSSSQLKKNAKFQESTHVAEDRSKRSRITRKGERVIVNYKEMSVRYGDIKLAVPNGFKELLENLSREILREQPGNIARFASVYFQRRLEARGPMKHIQAQIPLSAEVPKQTPETIKTEETIKPIKTREFIEPSLEEEKPFADEEFGEDADKAAIAIQAKFRGYQARKSLDTTDSTPDQSPAPSLKHETIESLSSKSDVSRKDSEKKSFLSSSESLVKDKKKVDSGYSDFEDSPQDKRTTNTSRSASESHPKATEHMTNSGSDPILNETTDSLKPLNLVSEADSSNRRSERHSEHSAHSDDAKIVVSEKSSRRGGSGVDRQHSKISNADQVKSSKPSHHSEIAHRTYSRLQSEDTDNVESIRTDNNADATESEKSSRHSEISLKGSSKLASEHSIETVKSMRSSDHVDPAPKSASVSVLVEEPSPSATANEIAKIQVLEDEIVPQDANEEGELSLAEKSHDEEESERRSSVLSQMSVVAEESDQKLTVNELQLESDGEKAPGRTASQHTADPELSEKNAEQNIFEAVADPTEQVDIYAPETIPEENAENQIEMKQVEETVAESGSLEAEAEPASESLQESSTENIASEEKEEPPAEQEVANAAVNQENVSEAEEASDEQVSAVEKASDEVTAVKESTEEQISAIEESDGVTAVEKASEEQVTEVKQTSEEQVTPIEQASDEQVSAVDAAEKMSVAQEKTVEESSEREETTPEESSLADKPSAGDSLAAEDVSGSEKAAEPEGTIPQATDATESAENADDKAAEQSEAVEEPDSTEANVES